MLLRPAGILIVSVPALPTLFTEFDAIQGHRRRDSPETLGAAFADSGLPGIRSSGGGRWPAPASRRHRPPARACPRPAHRRRSIDTTSRCLPGRFPGRQAGVDGRARHGSPWTPATGSSLFAVAHRPAATGPSAYPAIASTRPVAPRGGAAQRRAIRPEQDPPAPSEMSDSSPSR